MRQVLGKSARFRLAPVHDAAGDCASNIPLTFETKREAAAFVEQHKGDCWLSIPINSGRHVYTNWTPILNQRGSHHPKLNPYNFARRKIQYSPDMCARTLDILERTVLLGVPFKATVARARAVARKMI